MDIIPFEPRAHTHLIETWLRARKMPSKLAHDLPILGYLIYEKKEPICAGFLRHVEKHYAQLDSLITNPDSDAHLRNLAIDAVVGKLILTARKLGISQIMAHSTDAHTLLRSKKFGFEAMPHTLIVLDL